MDKPFFFVQKTFSSLFFRRKREKETQKRKGKKRNIEQWCTAEDLGFGRLRAFFLASNFADKDRDIALAAKPQSRVTSLMASSPSSFFFIIAMNKALENYQFRELCGPEN